MPPAIRVRYDARVIDRRASTGAPRARRVATLLVLGLLVCTAGCEALVQSLAENGDNPDDPGAHAHTLHNFDVYGNEIPPR